jgi:tetratricopeptide (TPR) repeat protein
MSTTGLPDFNTLWDYDRPAESERRFRDLLPAAQAAGDRDYHLQLLTQVARAQGLQRQYEAAHSTLDHVRSLMPDELKAVQVRYLLERGRCFNDVGKHDGARDAFARAWDVAREHRLDAYAVDAAHMLGILEPGEQGLAWNLRAIEYANASPDPAARRWLASLQNNLGWTYHAMGRNGDALTVFEGALRLRREQGAAGAIRLARYAVAKMHRLLGRGERALKEQSALLRECEAAREADGYVHEEVAECLLALEREEEARPHFARAYELLAKEPLFPPGERPRLERLKKLGATQ